MNSPAACSPPVEEKTRCASRSRSGSDAITAGSKTVVSADSGACGSTQMSLIEVFPHTPQAHVVMKFAPRRRGYLDARREGDVDDVPDLVVAVVECPQVVPSQTFIAAMSSRPRTIASPTRNPAASSTSSPGVRIVMVSAVPSTRIPSGSSAASRSARAEAVTPAGPPGLGAACAGRGHRDPHHPPPCRAS